jgi:hypothetical protein
MAPEIVEGDALIVRWECGGVGVLRLRSCFALRSGYFAQDDSVCWDADFRGGDSGSEEAESGERRAESGERRAESGERRAESGELVAGCRASLGWTGEGTRLSTICYFAKNKSPEVMLDSFVSASSSRLDPC